MIGASGLLLEVPIRQLRTRLEKLRGQGSRAGSNCGLAEMPIRVVPLGDGSYELVDGFKRLRWALAHDQATTRVLVERHCSMLECKAMLLRANTPRRTVSAMDEARVALSMQRDDGATTKSIAAMVGRKPDWVAKRLAIAERLASELQQRVDDRALGITLAHALTGLEIDAQLPVFQAVENHRLKGHEARALVSAYRVTTDFRVRGTVTP